MGLRTPPLIASSRRGGSCGTEVMVPAAPRSWMEVSSIGELQHARCGALRRAVLQVEAPQEVLRGLQPVGGGSAHVGDRRKIISDRRGGPFESRFAEALAHKRRLGAM